MQRIPNFLLHFLKLLVVLCLVGSFQVALAQSNDPVQDPNHQGNETTEPSRTSTPPVAGSLDEKTIPTASSAALAIGPGDEVEITVYGAPDRSEEHTSELQSLRHLVC